MGNFVYFWISELRMDPPVEAKLRWRRGLTPRELHQEFVGNPDLLAVYDSHPIHGDRWYVSRADVKPPKVVLVLVPLLSELDIWKVVTAFITSDPVKVGR